MACIDEDSCGGRIYDNCKYVCITWMCICMGSSKHDDILMRDEPASCRYDYGL